jgi:hypothetical protein
LGANLAIFIDEIYCDMVKVKDDVGCWRYELLRRPTIGGLSARSQSPFGAVAAQGYLSTTSES